MTETRSPTSLTSKRTAWVLLSIDAALYLDIALRWELGLGFFWHLRWLLVALLVAAVFWLFNGLVVRLGMVGVLRGLIAFPLWCWAFMMASTGNAYFDWRALPIVDFFRISWLDSWLEGGGFWTAGLAAAVHVALGPPWRRAKPPTAAGTDASSARRLGWALVIAACAAWLPSVEMRHAVPGPGEPPYVVYSDPRDATQSKRLTVDWVRRAYGVVVLGAGTWQLISAKRRVRSQLR